MRGLVLITLIVLGCSGSTEDSGAKLDISWRGSADGDLNGTAVATYCPATGLLEVIATQGDSGAGFVLFPSDSMVREGTYPIFLPAIPTETRPGALAALRWFDATRLDVFEGSGGEVRIESVAGDRLTGSLAVFMRGIANSDTLLVTGQFADVPVTIGDATCGTTSRRRQSAPLH
jgi:hypothetical protein